MVILGLNAYHGDSSAALIIDGKLVYAIEEERIRRQKHWAGLPVKSIERALAFSGIDIDEVDYIAVSRNPTRRIIKKGLWVLSRGVNRDFLKDRAKNAGRITGIKESLSNYFGKSVRAKLVFVEHHTAHIYSTYGVSPFEESAILTLDGFGDFASAVLGVGKGNNVKFISEVNFPHSLGLFYTAFTQFLGFPHYGDEYKVMGLSAYGKPAFIKAMEEVIRFDPPYYRMNLRYFMHATGGVDMTWMDGVPVIGKIYSPYTERILGKPRNREEEITERHMDIASSIQKRYEDIFFGLLQFLHKKTGIDNLSLAGGCIQNSLANGKILMNSPFRHVYIPPAAHDAGTAIGAGMYVWLNLIKGRKSFVMESPYTGDHFTESEIEMALKKYRLKYRKLDKNGIIKKAVDILSRGEILGWFQGRTEFGPRALGNRSILVDPRRQEMKDILNRRIKKREGFRPFAPSIPEEYASDWFNIDHKSPFMERVFPVRKEKAHLIPAVVHVDGTARVQTVNKGINPLYHKLLVEFGKKTGVPVLLNTSFNENEPIVNTPEDAINCFLRTGMDALIIENFLVEA